MARILCSDLLELAWPNIKIELNAVFFGLLVLFSAFTPKHRRQLIPEHIFKHLIPPERDPPRI